LSVVALGGGSVGDFAGFFSSVWKRGVGLIQIPSTWLAAIDSAHGGKNALNVGMMKNQIGTYAFARRIYLCRSLLFLQPDSRAHEAFGELAKIAILDGGDWVKELLSASALQKGGDLLWRFLPDAVSAKYRIVARDPFERQGIRQLLNLGHTVGHVLETVHRLPHGLAVAEGLRFALRFSHERGLLPQAELTRMLSWLDERFALFDLRAGLEKIPQPCFVELLTQDKKRSTATTLRFVLVRGFGNPEIAEVELSALVREAIRQGYVAAS
jgi:3-dehydroquinate synthase